MWPFKPLECYLSFLQMPPRSFLVPSTLIFLSHSSHFILFVTPEFHLGCFYDWELGDNHWNLVGSVMGTQLETMAPMLPESISSFYQFRPYEPLPHLLQVMDRACLMKAKGK